MRRFKKGMCTVLALSMMLTMLTGCGKDDKDVNKNTNKDGDPTPTTQAPATGGDEATPTPVPVYETLDKNTTGSLDIMIWSGDSVYHEDIGHQNWAPEDITTQNVAAVYAMAKKFNETYPNVKINLWAKLDDPNGNDTSWYQEMENFKAEHGKYPDIYASTDLSGDVSKGLVADLSVFADDPVYQSFNKSVMDTMNYYGFQAGLPQFIQPWGVYVNKELAEQNNIDVPEPNWNIEEYTEIATAGDNKNFWGAMAIPLNFINTGSKDMNYSLSNYSGDGDRINIASEEVVNLLSYVPKWAKSAVWEQNAVGNIPTEIMDAGGWWGYSFFCKNYLLTYDGDPWMLGAAAAPGATVNVVESNDWDIYPRPSTDYLGNTIGICIDPMAIHNYAMDDNNPAWSDAEKDQLKLAYTFGSYWCGSTQAMQARADQMYSDNGNLRSALNDSFPLVTGNEFKTQMDIWYSVDVHARYKDAEKMPGFQYVLKLWEEGQFWDISDKTYLYYVTEDGASKQCLYEWLNITSADIAGVTSTDPSWLDNVKARLKDFNTTINARFRLASSVLKDGLTKYYGFTDADFK